MAEDKKDVPYFAACWAGGVAEFTQGVEQPFVSLQIADARSTPSGAPLAEPIGEIRELFFTDPEQLVDFLGRALDCAMKMFPADVDRLRRGVKRRMH